LILDLVEKDIEGIAFGELLIAELVDGNDALALKTDVQKHLGLADLDHGAGHDLALLNLGQSLFVLVDERQHLVLGQNPTVFFLVIQVDDGCRIELCGQFRPGRPNRAGNQRRGAVAGRSRLGVLAGRFGCRVRIGVVSG